MINPKQITVIKEGASYLLPTYEVTNEGIVDGLGSMIHFCKGSTNDENIFRQEGLFVESLLELIIVQLNAVNIGELRSRETSIAITNLETAQLWLQKRAQDIKDLLVQGTYQK